MATVHVPALLRQLTGGRDVVTVPGTTVGQIVEQLEVAYPGMRARLCDGDRLRPGLAVVVDRQMAPLGLLQTVTPTSEVHFLPAIAGGEI